MYRRKSCLVLCLLIAALNAAGCSYGTTFALRPTIPPTPTTQIVNTKPLANPVISTGASLFTTDANIVVTVGTVVKFVDPEGNGGYHVLFSGMNGQYVPDNDVPNDLNSATGITFRAGDTHDFTFTKLGTHPITCLFHPGMNVSIIVVAPTP